MSTVDKLALAGEVLLRVTGTTIALDKTPKDLVDYCFEVAYEFERAVQEEIDTRGDAYR